MESLTMADKARMLAYKRPMLSSIGLETIHQGLCDISEACSDVHWFIENDDKFEHTYNDCTVALIGNRYQTIGYDTCQEYYFSLTAY